MLGNPTNNSFVLQISLLLRSSPVSAEKLALNLSPLTSAPDSNAAIIMKKPPTYSAYGTINVQSPLTTENKPIITNKLIPVASDLNKSITPMCLFFQPFLNSLLFIIQKHEYELIGANFSYHVSFLLSFMLSLLLLFVLSYVVYKYIDLKGIQFSRYVEKKLFTFFLPRQTRMPARSEFISNTTTIEHTSGNDLCR